MFCLEKKIKKRINQNIDKHFVKNEKKLLKLDELTNFVHPVLRNWFVRL